MFKGQNNVNRCRPEVASLYYTGSYVPHDPQYSVTLDCTYKIHFISR